MRRALCALTLALVLGATGCGGDDKTDESASPTTSTSPVPTTVVPASTSEPPSLEEATTFCEVFEALSGISSSVPGDADEARRTIAEFVDLLERLAAVAPDELSDEADVLRGAIEPIQQQAAAAGYDPEALNALPAFRDPGFQAAQRAMLEASARCRGNDTTAYLDALGALGERVAAAADACDIRQLNAEFGDLGDPKDPEQVRAAVELLTMLWRRLADLGEAGAPDAARVFRDLAATLPAEAERLEFDFAAISELPVLHSPEFEGANRELLEAAGGEDRCDPLAPG